MSKKSLMFIVLGAVLLVAAAIGGTLFISGGLQAGHSKPEAAPAAEEAHGAAKDASKEDKPAAETAGNDGSHASDGKSPLYHALDPAFVVNISDGQATRFLQVQVEVLVTSPSVVENIDRYQPRIRNDLIMLFSSIQRDDLRTVEGRAQMQAKTLETVNAALKAESGSTGVTAVYFTKLVIQ